jgi:hypothetical protein
VSSLIRSASASDKSKQSFYETSERQLDALQAAGILPRRSTGRFDYTSYYRPSKAANFHGAKLLYFEFEYLEEFIGCCVNDGFGLILQGTASDEVKDFARENGCKLNDGEQVGLPADIRDEFKTRGVAIDSLFELSCRANDAQ